MEATATRKIDELSRLFDAYRSLCELRAEVGTLEARIESVRAYSREPGANAALARAHRERLAAQHRDLTARLREARRRAQARLGLIGTDGISAI